MCSTTYNQTINNVSDKGLGCKVAKSRPRKHRVKQLGMINSGHSVVATEDKEWEQLVGCRVALESSLIKTDGRTAAKPC